MANDGDLRMLGARDGIIDAIIQIRRLRCRYDRPINPRHTRRIAERDRIVKPLRELEDQMLEQAKTLRETYEKTREIDTRSCGLVRSG